jgi:phosphoribosyl 1,2-cyclic phosphodiesterase
VDNVKDIVRAVKPKKVVLTHFGLTMLEAGPEQIARSLSVELGTEVIAATDGLVIPVAG